MGRFLTTISGRGTEFIDTTNTVWTFIVAIQKEQHLNEIKINQSVPIPTYIYILKIII